MLQEQLLEPLLSALSGPERKRVESVPIAILAIRTLNAQAIRAPNGRPVIALNQGLLALTSFWWEVKASVGTVRDESGIDGVERYLGEMYCFVLNFYMTNGQVAYPREFKKLKFEMMSRVLIYSIQTEMFVLAHEISHILAGHLDNSDVRAMQVQETPGAESVDFYQVSHQQEYEADYQGLQLYLKAWPTSALSDGVLKPLDVVAPLEFFALAALIERNIPRPDAFVTHPGAIHRLVRLLSPLFSQELEEAQIELRDQAVSLIEFARSMPDMSEFLVTNSTQGQETSEGRQRWSMK